MVGKTEIDKMKRLIRICKQAEMNLKRNPIKFLFLKLTGEYKFKLVEEKYRLDKENKD